MMRFSFDGDAKVWYITLPEATQKDYPALVEVFTAYWINGPLRPNLGQQQKQLTNMMQQTGQSAIEFINAVTSKAQGLDLSDAVLLRISESGLRPEYLPFFKRARATKPADLSQCEALQAVPAAVASVDSADLLVAMDRMLSEKLASLNLRAPQHPQHQDSPDVHAMQPTQQQRTSGYTSGYTPDHRPHHRYTPQPWQQYSDEQQDRPCGYCGTRCWGGKCPALGNLCTYTVTSQIIFPQYVIQNGMILSPNSITNNPTLGSTSSPDSISRTARNQLTINRGVRLSQHVVNHVGAGHIHQVQIALPLCPPTSQLPTYLTTRLTRNQSNLIRL